jgi:hypothetical protein
VDLVHGEAVGQQIVELAQERGDEHGLLGGVEEDDALRLGLLDQVLREDPEDVRYLLRRRVEDGIVLRDVCVRVGFVLWDTVDHLVLWLERFAGDLGDLRGNRSGEEESLSFFR